MLEIIETIEMEGLTFSALSNGSVVTGFELGLIDVEVAQLGESEGLLSQFLKSLSPSVLMRMWLSSQASFESDSDHSRKEMISETGYVRNQLKLFFEIGDGGAQDILSLFKSRKRESALERKALELKGLFDLTSIKSICLSVRPLSGEEIGECLSKSAGERPVARTVGVDTGSQISGVVRLVRQSPMAVTALTLAQIKDTLPLPYEIRVSVKRLPSEKSESLLRRKTSQAGSGQDKISYSKFMDAQNQLEDVALFGGSLFSMEVLILIPRKDERDLRSDAELIIQRLKPLGDWAIETFGAGQSFLSSSLGFDQHVTLLESDEVLPCYLPVWSYGRSHAFKGETSKRALVVHRRDQSLAEIDIFNPSYDNYSACIFGKSGKGKSVLTNLLTRALHHDENVRIIKIDVGGSHSKETSLLGGEERCLTLSEPSGINPFRILGEAPHSEDVCNVLSGFLNVLLLEEGETILSKGIRGEIERCVSLYSESRPQNPSLDDFYNHAKELPRRELLARWTGGGIFRNAFKTRANEEGRDSRLEPRLRYFNFSQIFQANDPDFGQGGLAAVMAQFNFDLMFSKGKKLVFIADETPFFIERCFSFFKFSTANVRKFGGSFITIAQKSSDVVVGGDTGIIENSSLKFLFSIDGERETFAKRLKLEERDLQSIESLQSIKGAFSEALFCDAFGSRVLRIQITQDEHWRFTSSQSDNEKLRNLLNAVPGLTLEEAISCLGR